MLPIRIKACSESDLRMLGDLARNIQRVLPVTQADIDAAAALGKGWVVWKAIEVTDPIDNLRGGTQLVIKENSITPGKNVRRVLIVSGPSGETVVIGPGPSPLLLPDAIADSLTYVKAFGGTEQSGVPQEYTRLDRLQGDGTAYIDLGITLNQDDEIEVDFIFKYASGSQIFGYRDSASSKNITLFFGSGAGSIYMDFNDSGYTDYRLGTTGTDDAQYTAKISKAKRALYSGTTEIAANSTACPDTFTTGNALLFFAGGNPSGTAKFAGSILEVRIKDRMHLVPAKRNSDDVLGMYDMITGQFFTNAAESGAFIAGDPVVPTPAYPADIVTNNGVLKARHQSGLPLGYTLLDYIESTGTQYIDTEIFDITDSEFVLDARLTATSTSGFPTMLGALNTANGNKYKVVFGETSNALFYTQPGTGDNNYTYASAADTNRHTFKLTTGATSGGTLFIDNSSFDFDYAIQSDATLSLYLSARNNTNTATNFITMECYGLQIKKSGVLVRNFVPCKNASNVIGMYDLVSGHFFDNDGTGDFVAGNTVSDPVEIYTDGTVETIKDSLNNTATAEMLLKIGNYQDEQEILSGVVTRKVGVLVLDGTEEIWEASSSILTNCYTVVIPLGDGPIDNRRVYCTHLTSSDTLPDANARQGYALLGNGGSSTAQPLTNKYAVGLGLTTSFPTIAGLKQWLADQYNAGTPVIIVYPLETETTESVAGQTLQVTDGNNTLEITQASLSGLELEAEYEKVA